MPQTHESIEAEYQACVAKGVDEYICDHARNQAVILLETDFPITERRSANRYGQTFSEDAGL